MEKVRKAIVPLAGLNLRMLPASKVIPKEMFPVAVKTIWHYADVNTGDLTGRTKRKIIIYYKLYRNI